MSLATTGRPDVGETPHLTQVNDVVVTVATSNGTGSQSANLILMHSIFNMGIPVSGKNMFPSNIQGLPTWFTVRANADGWTARKRDADVFVAMNVESVEEDVASLKPGAVLVVTKSLAAHVKRDDLTVYVVPFDELVVPVCKEARLRKMVVNIMYVGVLAYLLQIDMEDVKRAITRQFSKKASAAKLNTEAAIAGFEWSKANLPPQTQYRVERLNKTADKIIIEGNQAAGLGLVFGGVQVLAWYPITPSSSLCEAAIDYLDEFRKDPDNGKQTYAVVQAEDELASIAMVVGAGWAGARAATATAGPGISLMSEIAGLSYFAEIPAVILDVQRMGPSTGLPTRVSQGDMMKAYHLSHGDCKHPLLMPSDPKEAFEMAALSLDLAERLQTLVFVMLDLDLGMNSWMSKPFDYPTAPLDRGKVLSKEDIIKLGGEFQRYKDVDGDGIPYRTLPGTEHPGAAYFTRGTGHTEKATYSEKPKDWKHNMDRLAKKFDHMRTILPKPIIHGTGGEIGIIAFGSSDMAVEEARTLLQKQGVKTDYLRLRALPIGQEVRDFIVSHRVTYVVEQNRDAQTHAILSLDMPDHVEKLRSVLHYSGLPIDAQTVVESITEQEKKERN